MKFKIFNSKTKEFSNQMLTSSSTETEGDSTPSFLLKPEEDYKILQWTGFTDVEGTEVYEGDFVSYSCKWDEHGDLITDTGIIVFENGAFAISDDDNLDNLSALPAFSIRVLSRFQG